MRSGSSCAGRSARPASVIGIEWGNHPLGISMTLLASGGLDEVTADGTANSLLSIGNLTPPLAFAGLILLACVRGKVGRPQGAKHVAA